ncbi:MAG: molybdopterin biosynthesis protein MoeB [Betaproteobacteria bacterium RIFCSPLOWO2_02_FULL_65_20]|nr:MAG: molybdopterin biosynthesis protein MoeB [Betaproteobacteria bacterium RIFCSPLOWO2_02_FULL_65_20]
MNDDQLLRYSRHILLTQIGIEGQERLLGSRVLVIGVGGLGSPAAIYLAAAGVGHLTLVDGDRVDLTNLQRQILHTPATLGEPKVESARQTLRHYNAGVEVSVVEHRAEGEALAALIARTDVVLDCTDNFPTRHAINRACVRHGKPLVSGAAIRFDGQVCVFDMRDSASPCYACLFPENASLEEERCAVMGVFSPVTAVIGAIQAAEALKLLAHAGESLNGRLLILDALGMHWREVRIKKDPACAVCKSTETLGLA